MRILAMSDVHGNMDVYRWMKSLVREHGIDVVILAGDLLRGAGDDLTIEEAQRREAEELLPILKSLEVPVLYIMGNDDMIHLDYEDELIHAIHGRRVTVDDFNFVGYQFSPRFMGGIFEKPENGIRSDLLEIEPLLDEKTIFVTHTPARGVLDLAGNKYHVGSPSVSEVLERRPVRAHIHGHIHKCFGRQGIHFNVASGRKFRGIIIDPDNLTHDVVGQSRDAAKSAW